ncbi:MarR family winged helix-turn-helix transcriptional regulator [Actinocatenispora comari]|jgi:DNA-binding MarR family transcriptional regulator|uniref:MarR family transcriptional regulator n=1 Tax=Actinocatenispora comari TaxID=2807577 RepID=A0A8J4ELJ1_9ACTN|nr:MarR family transcriptional regulator [Actinocatenispora comari]GIL28581.1 MarR family transcriptional regulator [Actinocatenispora comari]
MPPEDWTDRHVARWRDHWSGITYDDQVEGIVTRIGQIDHYLGETMKRAAAASDLQESEYKTLHELMIRDTPGSASPGELAEDLKISGAGMTGRLDALEKKGWIRRVSAIDDRRRVIIQITPKGTEVWRGAMANRGTAEDELIASLTDRERATLNRILKKLTLYIESLPD